MKIPFLVTFEMEWSNGERHTHRVYALDEEDARQNLRTIADYPPVSISAAVDVKQIEAEVAILLHHRAKAVVDQQGGRVSADFQWGDWLRKIDIDPERVADAVRRNGFQAS